MSWTIHHGRSELILPGLGPYGACVTDPPYGLSFMNRDWDRPDNIAFRSAFWACVYGSLKPGAYLVAFGGTRKFHRLMVAIEDAGFELRDTLCWLYGQGMPKSHNVSKAIDKAAGAEREVVGSHAKAGDIKGGRLHAGSNEVGVVTTIEHTAPATDAAKQWDGYGTALSPSWEPIVLARKPLIGTVVANVLEHGTGALNIDGCRLALQPSEDAEKLRKRSGGSGERFSGEPYGSGMMNDGKGWDSSKGRWPPNVACDEEAALLVDAQSGERASGSRQAGTHALTGYGKGNPQQLPAIEGDTGGASRFFLRADWSELDSRLSRLCYVPKASTSERNRGLGDEQNTWPTVKPVALMRWLVRLVTPPGETVLDPFCGSGSTGVAAVLEGRDFVGIDESAEAVRLAKLRIHHVEANPAEVADVAPAATRQPELWP